MVLTMVEAPRLRSILTASVSKLLVQVEEVSSHSHQLLVCALEDGLWAIVIRLLYCHDLVIRVPVDELHQACHFLSLG